MRQESLPFIHLSVAKRILALAAASVTAVVLGGVISTTHNVTPVHAAGTIRSAIGCANSDNANDIAFGTAGSGALSNSGGGNDIKSGASPTGNGNNNGQIVTGIPNAGAAGTIAAPGGSLNVLTAQGVVECGAVLQDATATAGAGFPLAVDADPNTIGGGSIIYLLYGSAAVSSILESNSNSYALNCDSSTAPTGTATLGAAAGATASTIGQRSGGFESCLVGITNGFGVSQTVTNVIRVAFRTSATFVAIGSGTQQLVLAATYNRYPSLTNATKTIAGTGSGGATTGSNPNIRVAPNGPYVGSPGQAVNFGGFAQTYNQGATITGYQWNFGDNTATGSGQFVSHTYTAAGSYTVTLTATDSSGQSSSTTTAATIGGGTSGGGSGSSTTGSATANGVTANGGSRTVTLLAGCNNVAATFPDNTPTGTLVSAISPQAAVLAVWKLADPTTERYRGYSAASPQASDLPTLNRLDAIFVCVNGPATLREPTP